PPELRLAFVVQRAARLAPQPAITWLRSRSRLILLHQEIFRRMFLAIGAAQHGHRGSLLTRAVISRRRTVAIEFGMPFGTQGRSLWVGNRRIAQMAGTARRDEVLRGESPPARRSGIRKLRCTASRGGGSRATHVLRSD